MKVFLLLFIFIPPFVFCQTSPVQSKSGESSLLLANNKTIIFNSSDASIGTNFSFNKAKTVQVQIVSSEGKIMNTQQVQVAAGVSTQNMNTASLNNGAYYIRIVSEEGQTELKFVKER